METNPRSEHSKQVPKGHSLQNGDSRYHTGRVGHFRGFQLCLLHIPIHPHSRKYLRCQVQGITYQIKALPFGLSTAPMEVTTVAKEVKLMVQARGVRIHQYLDDWLIRAECHQQTLQLVALCQKLAGIVNLEKSELLPSQVFNFVGYQYDLRLGRVRPTQERWTALLSKIQTLLNCQSCLVRHLMSLIGLLTATEKQVHLGRLHMRPIQWHLKKHWRTPEVLSKQIPVPKELQPPYFGGLRRTSRALSANVYGCLRRRLGYSLK